MQEKIPQLRTIDAAYDELKARDPNTGLSRHLVRQLIKNDRVPCIQAGKKKLVDVNVLEECLAKMTGVIK